MYDAHPAAADPAPAHYTQAVWQAAELFTGGPLRKLRSKLRLLSTRPYIGRRAVLFVLIAWLPLLMLTFAQGTPGRPFLHDIGAFARYALAAPLLLAAEAVCLTVLGRIAQRFFDLLPAPDERERYVQTIGSVRRLLGHPLAGLAVVVLAYALSGAAHHAVTLSHLPAWYRSSADAAALSPAGWWHALVSLPMLLMLLLGWLWRLVVWTRFLFLVSRLDLALVAVHPDRAGGLGFVGYSTAAFAPVAAALGTIVAGAIANKVVYGGSSLANEKDALVCVALLSIALFTAPLLTLSAKLMQTMRRGAQQYNQLATAFGHQFEREWFRDEGAAQQQSMLDRGDFSAATDLYQVVDRVRTLLVVPVQLRGIVLLALATLLPFVPVSLMVLSFDTVLDALLGLLH